MTSRSGRFGRLVVAAGLAGGATATAAPHAFAASTPEWVRPAPVHFTTTAVEFKVTVGPNSTTCNVDADLRVPDTATAAHPAPAILTSNGFGGSKGSTGTTASNASYAIQYAGQGYVTLSYSGLGFASSTCPIELDSPAYDGQAAKALVSFLGGDTSQAFSTFTPASPTTPASWSGPVTVAPPVQLDTCDHSPTPRCGAADAFDPRVGMIGGSYGGENQFAVAGIDPRVDTIIPQITWNDLAYSLAPNNLGTAGSDGTAPVTQDAADPGVGKTEWTALFFGIGTATPIINPPGSGTTSPTCPNFDAAACGHLATTFSTGYPDQSTIDFLHSASAGQYLSQIHVPVFLSQGQDDTLFNLREAITTFKALEAQGTPAKMMWQQWGHSGPEVAGEADGTSAVPQLFDDLRYSAWFAKYLRGDTAADTGPAFEYLAPWIADNGSATTPDTAQYLGAPDYPVGRPSSLYLSGGTPTGTGALVGDPTRVAAGAATFTVNPSGATSYTETSGAVAQDTMKVVDAPGTFAAYSTAPLAADTYQVGSPTLTVRLSAPSFVAQSQPADRLVLFAKLYDVSADGKTVTLANRIISPVRVTDVTQPVTIHLPAIVHKYPAGDTMQLVLAASDAAYKGNVTAGAVQVVDSPAAPNILTIPTTDGTGAAAGPVAATPEIGLPVALVLTGGLAGAWLLRRRTRRTA